MKKFNFKGLEIHLHPEVYDPAEDTFLLIDSIDIKPKDSVFEIGTGCGIISLYCASLGANVICSDINPFAVELVKKNMQVNRSLLKGSFEVRLGSLFEVLTFGDKFDKIIFNPPYLPTKPKDLVGGSGWFDISVDGGFDGLSVTKKFIDNVTIFLADGGEAFFIFSSESDEKILVNYLVEKSLSYKILNSLKFDDEELFVYCIKLK